MQACVVLDLRRADVNPRRLELVAPLSASSDFVYSGCYSARLLPGSKQPSVHVAFPLESGNVQVFLRPSVQADGSLVLSSLPGPFGDDGAYVVVRNGRGRVHVRTRTHS